MKTVLTLPMPPSTNGLFVNGKYRRTISQKYEAWRNEALVEVLRQKPPPIKGEVLVSMEFEDPKTKRRTDLDNRLKAPIDLLVYFGIIEKDDNSIVREVRAKWSAEVEGVRITIQDLASTIFTDNKAA